MAENQVDLFLDQLARAMLTALLDADTLIADRGYDSDGYRAALNDKGITPCIPGRRNRKHSIS